MPHITGWLHDIHAANWGVDTYWLTSNQKLIRGFYPLTAEFFVAKTDRHTSKQIESHPQVDRVEKVSKYLSIHDWNPKAVLCVHVNPRYILSTYYDLRKYWGDCLFNADLSVYQQFCFQTGLFPYAYADIEIQRGKLQNNWKLLETYTLMDYQSVPFRTLWLQPTFEDQRFQRGKITGIITRHSVIDQEEEPVIFEGSKESELLYECVHYIQQENPDIIFTRGGDTFIPLLADRAVKTGVSNLRLGRGSRPLASYLRRPDRVRGHSYMTYGRVFFSQHGIYLDGGRHHYDVSNSFMWKEGNIEGIHELVRLGCSDPQRISRGTIGTTLTAVQMRTAYYRNILIPARKADAEAFRPAWSMASDVGGLVFSPQVGFHENITELDFLSMYPNIMVRLNVSPETINCQCCIGKQPVPLTSYHVCTRRSGLVSLSLRNILERRAYFKAHRNQSYYNQRQKVLKWLLVTSFGYQGYRNARFGRIEAHETISAYGRHALTQTQHLAASHGLEVVAGIVDSVWLKKPDGRPIHPKETEKLRTQIEQCVKIPLEHAADYYWIVFLPRRHEPTIGVLNRYYGLKRDKKFKIRGIEIRQSSVPLFIKKMQQELLNLLAKARSREQFQVQLKHAKNLMRKYLARLTDGKIPLKELLISIRPSRSPEEYLSNTRQAIAAIQLAKSDVKVEPGMKLSYLIINANAKEPMERVRATELLTGDEQYDVEEYRKLVIRAYEGIVPPEFEEKDPTLDSFF
jgi:DNA polymerase-2